METKVEIYGVAVINNDGKGWTIIGEAFSYAEAGRLLDMVKAASRAAHNEHVYTTIYFPGEERP